MECLTNNPNDVIVTNTNDWADMDPNCQLSGHNLLELANLVAQTVYRSHLQQLQLKEMAFDHSSLQLSYYVWPSKNPRHLKLLVSILSYADFSGLWAACVVDLHILSRCRDTRLFSHNIDTL